MKVISRISELTRSKAETGILGSINLNIAMASVCGAPFYPRNTTLVQKASFAIYHLVVVLIVVLLYTYYEFLDLIDCWGDLDTFTQNACLTMTHIGGIIKAINLTFRIKGLLKTIDLLGKVVAKYTVREDQKKTFLKFEEMNKKLFTYYATIVFTTSLFAFVILLKSPEEAGQTFPYRARIPTELPQSARILFHFVSVTVIALLIVSIDSLNMNLINQIHCQLKVLNLSLETLSCDDLQESIALDKLHQCIEHHQLIIRLQNEIESVFKVQVLIQIVTSLSIFGLTGFQATVRSDLNRVSLVIYFYIACIFSQLLIYCLLANQTKEQSKSLAMKGYFSSWYNFGPKFSKTLLIFLINAQRPMIFTGGGFFELSLNTFTDILSRSYSYVALLRQLYGD